MNNRIKSVVGMVLVMVMVLTLAGCGEIKKAEASVNGMLAAFKSGNLEDANKYVDVDKINISNATSEITPDAHTMMKMIFKNLDYKIVSSEKKDNNTVVVKTKITTTDMKPVMGDFFKNAFSYAFENAFSYAFENAFADPQPSEEEVNKKMMDMFTESMSKDNLATVTKEIDITVKKTDKEWIVQTDDKFADVVMGGLVSAVEEISDAFNMEE